MISYHCDVCGHKMPADEAASSLTAPTLVGALRVLGQEVTVRMTAAVDQRAGPLHVCAPCLLDALNREDPRPRVMPELAEKRL